MRRIIILVSLTLSLTLSLGISADGPEEVIQQYFLILTSENYENIGSLMDSASMAGLKELMVDAIRQQTRTGRSDLQKRIFGKKVTLKQVRETSADFYLHKLAEQILYAAHSQNFIVEGQDMLGRIDENADTAHFLARVRMSQGDKSASTIRVYTIIREEAGWKMKFPDTISQMLQVIEASAYR
jgi:hypothetical protein